MVFRWSLSDSKSPQVSRTLLSILAILSNVVVWMVSARPPNSRSSNCNWYNCHLHVLQLVQLPSKVEVLIPLFPFFQFYSVVSRDSKVDYFASSFFFFLILFSLVFWPRFGDPCVCQSPIGVHVCHFLGQVLDCAYTIC